MVSNDESTTFLKVFLCHSSGDKAVFRALYERLIRDGFDAWLDEKKLIGGQDWKYEIRKAVRKTDLVVVCLSNSSASKTGFIQKELKFALDVADEQPEGTIFIIPLRLEPCDVPERLSQWQWVDYFRDGGYEKLVQALRARRGSTAAPPKDSGDDDDGDDEDGSAAHLSDEAEGASAGEFHRRRRERLWKPRICVSGQRPGLTAISITTPNGSG